MTAEAAGPDKIQSQALLKPPGEEAACLQIAIFFLGTLLLIAAILISRWRWSRPTGLGVLALLLGVILAGAGGFYGLGERRGRGSRLMSAGATIVTLAAVMLLLTAGDDFNWHVPLGSIFLTLAIFSSAAAYKFRRVVTGQQP